jgi:hypothetical protein
MVEGLEGEDNLLFGNCSKIDYNYPNITYKIYWEGK